MCKAGAKFCKWKTKYAGVDVSAAERLQPPGNEKKLPSTAMLDYAILMDNCTKKR